MKKLELAPRLTLPADAATQVYAFMGKRGSGKTYAAGKLTELLLEAGVQTIVMDPVGNWWGLRLGADGKHAGFEIPVLGGEHGDIPLAVDAGVLVADMLVDTGSSAILDVSPFSKSARKTFIGAFAEHFFQRKKTSRSAVHVVLEEAHLVLPQKPNHGEERMLGALEDLVRLGRNYGIGVSMLDQRPQSVSKEALNQAEVLLAFQLIGSHERDAIKKWVDYHGSGSDLATLNVQKPGEAVVWAPWLEKPGVYRVNAKTTFDSSSTPKAGASAKERKIKPLDLRVLEQRMGEVVEQVKANDPKALRARIAELEKQVAAKKAPPAAKVEVRTIEKPLIKDAQLTRAENLLGRMEKTTEAARAIGEDLAQESKSLRNALNFAATRPAPPPLSARPLRDERPRAAAPIRAAARSDADAGGELQRMDRAFLTALAQRGPRLAKGKLLVYTGYRSSGDTSTSFARMTSNGWTSSPAKNELEITDAGRAVLGPYEPLPTGAALRELALSRLPKMAAAFLRILFDEYPNFVAKGDLLERAGYRSSGDTSTAFAHLAGLDYAEKDGVGFLRAGRDFFE